MNLIPYMTDMLFWGRIIRVGVSTGGRKNFAMAEKDS